MRAETPEVEGEPQIDVNWLGPPIKAAIAVCAMCFYFVFAFLWLTLHLHSIFSYALPVQPVLFEVVHPRDVETLRLIRETSEDPVRSSMGLAWSGYDLYDHFCLKADATLIYILLTVLFTRFPSPFGNCCNTL